ncbi:MAG: bifunctional diaminohydroxyphosphoribosylaminopyrimidine deaminase/5-amino-6-(5-phosphoribosylamino)uracil reductase RibD [Paludibacteraceae bacterium]|nr:bifunctional diaminohydroxyphosphoribosylaminopyrimidine deaminase/5-amino-6-(5-phosphoribosylamino)uracil reductase RibD [Paludibacteraceae bacterium]
MQDFELYIRRCLQLAKLGEYYVAPNPMVGAVLVGSGDVILGEGWHMQYGGAHAEPNCLRNAEDNHPEGIDYKHCTLYVNLEPCSHYGKTPPCAELIIDKGIGRVVIGCLDPNPQVAGQGVSMLKDAGIKVHVGILEDECRALNKRFICLHENRRPYVILKWAQTADGYIDERRKSGNPLVISTPLMKQLVHQQRAENMAIMVGTRTVLMDNPRLLTTHWSGRNPIRVTMDRHRILSPDYNIFSSDSETIVYHDNTDWKTMLTDLASRNIHSVLVEGGATFLNSIIASQVYDEVHIEISNEYMGEGKLGVEAPHYKFTTRPQIFDRHLVYIENRV